MLRSIIFFFLSLSVLSLCTPAPVVQRSLSAADKQAYLSAHNNERAKFGAEALVWSDKLANAAASWANHCIFKHSGGTLGPFGENLAAGTDESPASAVGSWNKESSAYPDFDFEVSAVGLSMRQANSRSRTHSRRTSPRSSGRRRSRWAARTSHVRRARSSRPNSGALRSTSASTFRRVMSSARSGKTIRLDTYEICDADCIHSKNVQ
jgi:hypothetical protein